MDYSHGDSSRLIGVDLVVRYDARSQQGGQPIQQLDSGAFHVILSAAQDNLRR